jgi:hypothetical protein
MQVKNKKAMRKLEKEIADDEAQIDKYEASGKEGSDGDDDDITSEGKKKHIKQVLNSFHLNKNVDPPYQKN